MNLKIPSGAEIKCTDSKGCPAGFACNPASARCIPVDRTDVLAPTLLSAELTPTIAGRVGAGFQAVSLTVTLDEPVSGSPVVYFNDSGVRREFSQLTQISAEPGKVVYAATYQPTGEETEASFFLQASLEDSSTNRFDAALPVSLSFDFTTPVLLTTADSSSLTLLPDSVENPLAREVALLTRSANRTTRVLLSFTVSEDVATPTLTTEPATDVQWKLFGRAGNTWTYEIDWAATTDALAGHYALFVTLVDAAGNTSVSALESIDLNLRTATPSRPNVDADRAIRFIRAPWGRAADPSSSSGKFTLEVEPDVLPAQSWVLVYRDVAGEREIGRARTNERGAIGGPDNTAPFLLATSDTDTVYIRVADEAGNVSLDSATQKTTAVRDVAWVTSPTGRSVGDPLSNPHSVRTTSYVAPYFEQSGFTEVEGASFGFIDDRTMSVVGGGTWEVPTIKKRPQWSYRVGQGMAYNPLTGTTFVAGGNRYFKNNLAPVECAAGLSPTFDFLERHREPNWSEPTRHPASPIPSAGPASLVYDGTRKVMMMRNSAQWSWRESRWTDDCAGARCGDAKPTGTAEPMVYDPVRKRVYAFVSGADVRAWDGSTWSYACGGVACTGPTGGISAVAFDDQLNESVAYGFEGGQQTWSFNGTRWQQLCVSDECLLSRPPARLGAKLVFDRARNELVMFGGQTTEDPCSDARVIFVPPEVGPPNPPFGDTWVFANDRWTLKSPAHQPEPRAGHSMVYDALRERVILQGGTHCACRAYNGYPDLFFDTWAWDGTDWQKEAGLPVPQYFYATDSMGVPTPTPSSSHHQMTTDPVSEAVVMVGGGIGNDLMMWRNGAWFTKLTAGISRGGAVLVSRTPLGSSAPTPPVIGMGATLSGPSPTDPFTNQLIDWGFASACGNDPCVTNFMNGRYLYGAASDGTDIILFGGTNWYRSAEPEVGGAYSNALNETWRFTGAGWFQTCTTPPCNTNVPPARAGHAMSYTGNDGELIMFGGASNMSLTKTDTWLWRTANGGEWFQFIDAREAPLGRVGHSMVLDNSRNAVILFGGTSDPGSEQYVDFEGPKVDALQHEIAVEYQDVWEWQDDQWHRVKSVTPRPTDTSPETRFFHNAAWSPADSAMVVYGGNTSPEIFLYGPNRNMTGSDKTWLWHPEPEGRPGLVFDANLAAGGALLRQRLVAIETEWHGDAVGETSAQQITDAAISVWDGTGWRDLPATNGTCASGTACYDSRQDPSFAEPGTLERWIDGQQVHVKFAPLGRNGQTSARSSLETDAFEVRFWTRLPPSP